MSNNMEVSVLLFSALLLVVSGGRIERQVDQTATEDECVQAPENTEMISCCDMPKHHIWGKIKRTIKDCIDEIDEGDDNLEQEQEGTTEKPPKDKKSRSRGMGYVFRYRAHDGCFAECLFEREGFLYGGTVDKSAIIERFHKTLRRDKYWETTAVAAAEKCLSDELEISANETCTSGSAEALKCIYREMFLNCPYWLENNDYCTSLKEFYVKCPNGPPPQVFMKRRHQNRKHYYATQPKYSEGEPEVENETEVNSDKTPQEEQ